MKKNGDEPKRKPGAQPGNLNNAQSILPALERLKRGRSLPGDLQRVITLAENERQGLIDDRGGEDTVSNAERLATGGWKGARAAELLIWDHILKGNPAIVTDPKTGQWDLAPGISKLIGLLSVQARFLSILGMERKARNVSSLETYIEKNYPKEEEKKDGKNIHSSSQK